MTFVLTLLGSFVVFFLYSSLFEWALHLYLMHSDKIMKYPHRAHQLEHHEIYKADATYEIQPDGDYNNLTFAWWNAPLLIALHTPLWLALYFTVGVAGVLGALAAMAAYYGVYEYLHFCMHVPTGRFFERTAFFKYANNHHRLHHVYFKKNLNVVFPFADLMLGTMVRLKDQPGIFEKLEETRQRRTARAVAQTEQAIANIKAAASPAIERTEQAIANIKAAATPAFERAEQAIADLKAAASGHADPTA